MQREARLRAEAERDYARAELERVRSEAAEKQRLVQEERMRARDHDVLVRQWRERPRASPDSLPLVAVRRENEAREVVDAVRMRGLGGCDMIVWG